MEPQVSLKEAEDNVGQPDDREAKDDTAESEARMRERLLRRAKYRIRKRSSPTEAEKRSDSTSPLEAAGTLETCEEPTGEVEPPQKRVKVEKVSFSLRAPLLSPSLQSDDVFTASVDSEAKVEPETGEKKSVVELSKGAGAAVVGGIAREVVGGGEPKAKKERSIEEPGTPVQDERAEQEEREVRLVLILM